jgi:hypothetical protein
MLLVEVFNGKQAEVLLKAKLLGSHLAHVKRHTSLNLSQGVITTDILNGISDKEIQTCLAYQFVPKAYRLVGKRNSKPFSL